jgi:hypothetical protein
MTVRAVSDQVAHTAKAVGDISGLDPSCPVQPDRKPL